MEELCITVVQQKRAKSLITYGSGEGLDPLNIQDPGLTRLEAEKGERQVFSGLLAGFWSDVYTMQ